MPSLRLVVFDFDGTLADTHDAVSTTLNAALHAHGLPRVHPPVIHSWMGVPLEVLIGRLLPRPDRDRVDIGELVAFYREHFATLGAPKVRALPGALRVLSDLGAAGVRLGIATSREEATLQPLLDQLCLAGPFEAIATCDQVEHGKPAADLLELVLARTGVAPQHALMVGDTHWDLEMARSAGVPAVGVTTGTHDRGKLQGAEPEVVLDHLDELMPHLFDHRTLGKGT